MANKTKAELTKDYRKRNPDKVKAWVKKWRNENPELIKEYARKGREKRKALKQSNDQKP